MTSPVPRRAAALDALLIAALCVLAFSSALGGKYCYDDIKAIENCRAIESWRGLPVLLSRDYCPASGELTYRPLVTLSYFVDAAAFGKSPYCSRLLNLLLHATVSIALYGLWLRLFRHRVVALLAAAVFACHPIVTEVVDCPGFREEVLCLLFIVLAFHAILAAARSCISEGAETLGRAYLRMLVAACLWFLALLSKEPGVMLVLLVPMLAFASPVMRGLRQRADSRCVVPLLVGIAAFGLAFLAYAVLYRELSFHGPRTAWPGGRGPALGFLNFCRTFVVYARLWLWPRGLSVGHEFEPSVSYADPRLWWGLAAFSAFVSVSAMAYTRRRLIGVGGAWACIMMIPLMQIIPSPELLAERYVYMAHAGAALMAAGAILALQRVMPRTMARQALIALSAGLLCLYVTLTSVRNRDWSDDITLNIRRYELWHGVKGKVALGNLYLLRGNYVSAAWFLKEVIRTDPHFAEAHYSLGRVFSESGQTTAAASCFLNAYELDPANVIYRGVAEQLGAVRKQEP